MRAVSDFLDRVATRALGSESMLSPRLPSLFEPAGRGGAAVTEEPVQIQAAPAVERTQEQAVPNVRRIESKVLAQAPELAPARSSAHASTAQADRHEHSIVTEEVRLFSASKPSVREAAIEPASPRTVSRQEPASTGELQPLKETRILRERTTIETSHEEAPGELLPPGQPVFATRPEAGARRTDASSPAPAKALAGTAPPSSEPAVHVSIGRLEVRAAPTNATAPRAAAPSRPSALDDYLRQRGGTKP